MSAKSIFVTSFIMKSPTMIKAGAVAYPGTIPTIGTNKIASKTEPGG